MDFENRIRMTSSDENALFPSSPPGERGRVRGDLLHLNRPKSWGFLCFSTLLFIAAALLLFFFPPEQHAFYPRCLFYTLTGFECPGCGSLRATHRLLHGDLASAFRFNPLLVILAPVAGLWLSAYGLQRITGRKMWSSLTRPILAWALLAVGIAFGILRNIPI